MCTISSCFITSSISYWVTCIVTIKSSNTRILFLDTRKMLFWTIQLIIDNKSNKKKLPNSQKKKTVCVSLEILAKLAVLTIFSSLSLCPSFLFLFVPPHDRHKPPSESPSLWVTALSLLMCVQHIRGLACVGVFVWLCSWVQDCEFVYVCVYVHWQQTLSITGQPVCCW